MKIAYCIVCHKFSPVLAELVELVGGNNDIFVHIDAKSDMVQFAPIVGRVNFVGHCVRVEWGTYSQIEATLRLLDAARASDCEYIALVSGDTLPLKTEAEIKRYLWKNRGREFVYELPLKSGHIDRVRYKHPAADPRGGSVWAALKKRLRLLPRNPYYATLPPLAFGSNWFVITPEFRDYIFDFLGRNPEFTEAFRHSRCGDELFFATIIENSPFAARRDTRRYMYVDWETGPQFPRTLDASDFPRLEAAAAQDSDREFYLFARKFSDTTDLAEYRARLGL